MKKNRLKCAHSAQVEVEADMLSPFFFLAFLFSQLDKTKQKLTTHSNISILGQICSLCTRAVPGEDKMWADLWLLVEVCKLASN